MENITFNLFVQEVEELRGTQHGWYSIFHWLAKLADNLEEFSETNEQTADSTFFIEKEYIQNLQALFYRFGYEWYIRFPNRSFVLPEFRVIKPEKYLGYNFNIITFKFQFNEKFINNFNYISFNLEISIPEKNDLNFSDYSYFNEITVVEVNNDHSTNLMWSNRFQFECEPENLKYFGNHLLCTVMSFSGLREEMNKYGR